MYNYKPVVGYNYQTRSAIASHLRIFPFSLLCCFASTKNFCCTADIYFYLCRTLANNNNVNESKWTHWTFNEHHMQEMSSIVAKVLWPFPLNTMTLRPAVILLFQCSKCQLGFSGSSHGVNAHDGLSAYSPRVLLSIFMMCCIAKSFCCLALLTVTFINSVSVWSSGC